jgi:hypothetical protein
VSLDDAGRSGTLPPTGWVSSAADGAAGGISGAANEAAR